MKYLNRFHTTIKKLTNGAEKWAGQAYERPTRAKKWAGRPWPARPNSYADTSFVEGQLVSLMVVYSWHFVSWFSAPPMLIVTVVAAWHSRLLLCVSSTSFAASVSECQPLLGVQNFFSIHFGQLVSCGWNWLIHWQCILFQNAWDNVSKKCLHTDLHLSIITSPLAAGLPSFTHYHQACMSHH